MRTINTKFDIGDEIYFIWKIHKRLHKGQCKTCDGSGYILACEHCQQKKLCPECKPAIEVQKYYWEWVCYPKSYKIEKINIFIDNKEIEITYENDNYDGSLFEEKLFGTVEEAEAKCKELNEKEKN